MVIPVLVGGARMPAAHDLPAELAELSLLNAIEIRDERFDQDVVELETFLAGKLHLPANDAEPRTAWPPLVVVPLVLVGIAGILLRPAPGGGPVGPAWSPPAGASGRGLGRGDAEAGPAAVSDPVAVSVSGPRSAARAVPDR